MAVGQRLAKGLSLERTGITPIALACRRRCAHGMSVWGHERPKGDVRVESALPSTSNIGQRGLTRGASNCHQNRRAAGLIHIKTAVECLLQRIKGHRPAIAAAVASQGNMTHHWPRNVVLTALAIATAVIFPMGSPVQAQSSADQPSAVDSKSAEYPFGFKAYGAYQKMITEQNYAPVLQLNDVVAGRVTDAVGAVSGLRGEISMIDGRLIVSYGVDCGTACPLLPSKPRRCWPSPRRGTGALSRLTRISISKQPRPSSASKLSSAAWTKKNLSRFASTAQLPTSSCT